MSHLNRREFIEHSGKLSVGAAVASGLAAEAKDRAFASQWQRSPDRVWLGAEYWANPLQDWRLGGGRIECVNAAPERNVHLLTRQLGAHAGELRLNVRLGRLDGKRLSDGRGSAGFRIGAQGPLREYRNNAIFGAGLNAGVTADGGLFLGSYQSAQPGAVRTDLEALELRVRAVPHGDTYTLTLEAFDPAGQQLGKIEREKVPAEQLVGNVALVANFGQARGGGKAKAKTQPGPEFGAGRFWFSDWKLAGSKFEAHDEHAYGPILFSHYTLSGSVLKLTAQMPPLGANDSQTVRLQTRTSKAADWKTIAEEKVHPEARTSTFRIPKWNDRAEVPYRLAYTLRLMDGREEEHFWTGTIRRDPVDQPVLTVADVSCNIHAAFPNSGYVANMAKLNPDLLAFVGDQFYESTGGYGVVRKPVDTAILDYLRKWYMHGWTWRELTRDRPSLSLPDDHDVYQGNVWGDGGAPKRATQEMGGYDMPAAWVNVVHRTQTAHHPDPYDPTPVKQNISVYYGPMTYGRVSFAILADRQFKTGPEGVVPATGGRGDHVTDPKFDPKTADVPGAVLLGDRQMKFLRDWAADWRGADLKAVVSQTIFTAMATTHGAERLKLRADYDANGWPQTPRNAALREIRKAFAVHLAGDQHLPAVVHYGIDAAGDAAVAFAGPAVNVGYPRWFEPATPGRNRKPGAGEITGEFTDHFGHPLTVLAVANGAVQPRRPVLENLKDKASGLGLVRFDKARRTITFECWPFLAEPTQPNTQFPGWPVTVRLEDNYGRKPVGFLPTLKVNNADPVVQVVSEADGDIVYTLRIAGRSFQPPVFATGKYTVRLSYPESGRHKELKGLEATRENAKTLAVTL